MTTDMQRSIAALIIGGKRASQIYGLDLKDLTKSFDIIWGPWPFRNAIIDWIVHLMKVSGPDQLAERSGIPINILHKLAISKNDKEKKKYITNEYYAEVEEADVPTKIEDLESKFEAQPRPIPIQEPLPGSKRIPKPRPRHYRRRKDREDPYKCDPADLNLIQDFIKGNTTLETMGRKFGLTTWQVQKILKKNQSYTIALNKIQEEEKKKQDKKDKRPIKKSKLDPAVPLPTKLTQEIKSYYQKNKCGYQEIANTFKLKRKQVWDILGGDDRPIKPKVPQNAAGLENDILAYYRETQWTAKELANKYQTDISKIKILIKKSSRMRRSKNDK